MWAPPNTGRRTQTTCPTWAAIRGLEEQVGSMGILGAECPETSQAQGHCTSPLRRLKDHLPSLPPRLVRWTVPLPCIPAWYQGMEKLCLWSPTDSATLYPRLFWSSRHCHIRKRGKWELPDKVVVRITRSYDRKVLSMGPGLENVFVKNVKPFF